MHIEKFKAHQLGQVCAHISRARPSRAYGNENIDKGRTPQNYSLIPVEKGHEVDRINKRISEVSVKKNRADIVRLVGITLTLPKDYDGDERAFFEAAHKAFCERYGRENVAYSYVHKDEKTPHLHIGVVPIIRDKDGRERLCFDKAFPRKEYSKLHPEIEARMRELLPGRTVRLLNDETERDPSTGRPYKNVKELKKAKEREERALSKEIADLKKERQRVRTQMKRLQPREQPRGLFPDYRKAYEQAERERQAAVLLSQEAAERERQAVQEKQHFYNIANNMAQTIAEQAQQLRMFERIMQDPDTLRQRADGLERVEREQRERAEREREQGKENDHEQTRKR